MNGVMERWPNFYIVGAPKAGTTSLYEYLKDIPGIYMSPVKEPHYFLSHAAAEDDPNSRHIQDKKKYLKLFAGVTNETIIGEASTGYLSDPNSPKLIKEVSPTAKIIISLRDPVERLFSSYLMKIRNRRLTSSFHQQIKQELQQKKFSNNNLNPNKGMYYENVKRYLDIFGEKQVKIIIFEEWVKKAKQTTQDILNFLEINYKIREFPNKAYNPYFMDKGTISTKIRRSRFIEKVVKKTIPQSIRLVIRDNFFVKNGDRPTLNDEDRQMLNQFYHKDVVKLSKLIGRKLLWKNFEDIDFH